MKNLLTTLIIAVLVTSVIGCAQTFSGATGPLYAKAEASLPELKAGMSRIFSTVQAGLCVVLRNLL